MNNTRISKSDSAQAVKVLRVLKDFHKSLLDNKFADGGEYYLRLKDIFSKDALHTDDDDTETS